MTRWGGGEEEELGRRSRRDWDIAAGWEEQAGFGYSWEVGEDLRSRLSRSYTQEM